MAKGKSIACKIQSYFAARPLLPFGYLMTQRIITLRSALPAALIFSLLSSAAFAQLNKQRGNGPGDVPEITFVAHRFGTDHAEGIASLDMNQDGRPDLLRRRLLVRESG